MGFALHDFSATDLPGSFEEAGAIEASHTSRWSGKLTHNTLLVRVHDAWAVCLHRTNVVTFHPDGRITLRSDGWQTATTRDRMRRCGVSIYTEQGVAAVTHGGRDWTYADGMELLPDGGVNYGDRYVNGHPETVRKLRRRNRRRGTYVPCENQVSSCWHGGNVPEAFETP